VAQLNLKLADDQLDRLRSFAARRRTPVTWLLKDYIDYLLTGGVPVTPTDVAAPTAGELAQVAQQGGAFDWLRDEPDVYTLQDGEPL